MSLDIFLSAKVEVNVFEANITHNLTEMAKAAGIYQHVWRPEEVGINKAKQLIEPLRIGIAELRSNPEAYKKFDAQNGWGTYQQFIPWLEEYLLACEKNPEASIEVCR